MFVNTPNNNQPFDYNLRPRTWQDYIGQDKIKKTLEVMISAAKKRNQALDHVLFHGSPGLGKTTLAGLIANKMGTSLYTTSGPAIKRSGDLASILSNLSEGDILFIDEIHRLHKSTEEMIYPAMEDFKMNIVVGKGPMAQSMEIEVPPFTLIGATTKMSLLSPPFRSRFGAVFQLNTYNKPELKNIIKKSSINMGIDIEDSAVDTITGCCRSTPRIANQILKRVRDFAQVNNDEIITSNNVTTALDHLEIDYLGLGKEDRKILLTLINKYDGGPIGIKTLAACTKEDEDTLLDVYEPYLLELGFLERTQKGRIATKLAYNYLKIKQK